MGNKMKEVSWIWIIGGILVFVIAYTQLMSGPLDATITTTTSTTTTSTAIYAGWRSSEYGYQQEVEPPYWVNVANAMADKIPGSKPGGIWILGTYQEEDCKLSFSHPGNGESYSNIAFASEDKNERYLQVFDEAGLGIWLQVEPANANVDQLIDLVLDRYKHHSSVIGFGIDVEWLESQGYPEGRPVTNEEAERWISKVKSHNPDYKLFLKHWDRKWMPTEHYEDLVLINDAQDLSDLDDMLDLFIVWGSHFSDSEVGFQFGYKSDFSWWNLMDDPFSDIGTTIINEIPNCSGVYWVDFTITQLFSQQYNY